MDVGASVDLANTDGDTPLICACDVGQADIVGILLRAAADVNAANSVGGTPLICACKEGHPQIVQLLLAAGAEKDVRAPVESALFLSSCIR